MAAGFDLGGLGDQVTVAKQRTMFQTQTLKCGEVDVSCKDYVLSWGRRLARVDSSYMPDLHSAFGVERDTGKKIRLPTPTWPFDHAGVAARFKLVGTGLASRVLFPFARSPLRLLRAISVFAAVISLVWPAYRIALDECWV